MLAEHSKANSQMNFLVICPSIRANLLTENWAGCNASFVGGSKPNGEDAPSHYIETPHSKVRSTVPLAPPHRPAWIRAERRPQTNVVRRIWMTVTDDLLANNARYAATFDKGDLPLPPGLGLAVVACMDARLAPPLHS